MKAVIVYELVPDETRLYFVDVNEDQVVNLMLAHGNYEGGGELSREVETAVQWLSSMVFGEWSGNEVEGPCVRPVDMVIISGALL